MTQKEFEQIAMQARTRAVGVAGGFGLSTEEAEDVAQDVMLKLWCMHDDIPRHDPVEVLAGLMARRLCIDKWRLRKHEEEADDSLWLMEENDPHRLLEYKELERWLFRRIEQLPTTSGIILRMRQLEHRELGEIASLLGITQASVSTLLSRARKQLLDELKRRNKQ
ncbi:MAG: sigma-70 family RNA polymerase sigma factor [Bacteroidaceae bacterium]|nr:sigma-70 family RNA polymerase sigma factor [Bacteroidaceae bacterium]